MPLNEGRASFPRGTTIKNERGVLKKYSGETSKFSVVILAPPSGDRRRGFLLQGHLTDGGTTAAPASASGTAAANGTEVADSSDDYDDKGGLVQITHELRGAASHLQNGNSAHAQILHELRGLGTQGSPTRVEDTPLGC